MSQGQGGFATTLPELLRLAIGSELTEMHVCMPGKIESYDSATGTASIKPTLSRRFRGAAEPIEYPVIPKVPVVQPRTASAQVTLPIVSGDLVLIVFADRSIENWDLSPGTEAREVRDLRRHDLSDAFAILGGYPSLNPSPSVNGSAYEVLVKPETKIALGNGTAELIQLVHDLMDYVETKITFSNGGGPTGPPTNATLLGLIRAKLEQIKV